MVSQLVFEAVWPVLHISSEHWRVLHPAESHKLFGAGFLFVGTIMAAETLSGGVWHRSRVRTLMFPAILVLLGWGMFAVTAVETNARAVHFSMGLPMIAAGWAEARSRLEGFPRRYADGLIASALVLAAVDTAFFHLSGPPMSAGVMTHAGLAVLAVMIAFLRLYQGGRTDSLARGLAVAFAVILVSIDLWIDGATGAA